MSGEKTEKPTDKRRKEARKEGQVPRTPDLGGWAALLVFAMTIQPIVGYEWRALSELLVKALRMTENPQTSAALDLMREALVHVLTVLLVLGSAVMLVGVASALSQGGFYLATKTVQPKLSKLDPLKGAKRILGPQAVWQGVKVLIKAAVVAVFITSAVRAMIPLLGGLMPTSTVLGILSWNVTNMLRNVAMAGILMAGVDYAFQRRRVGKQTRMSKHDVKQEHKQSEGDPLVRSAIRSQQLAMSRSRMIAAVPTADVVLVNPTHVAVALKYDPNAGAPTVVARGAGVIAARIREAAQEASVPLVRDVPLARALHQSCSVGQQIPPELFAAVAQVLAFVISRRKVGVPVREHPSPRGGAPLPDIPRRRARPVRVGADVSVAPGSGR
ncbi:MAG: EscU/YscU/HrcU family type III secretion system export apparatus switch protein [Candidatus Nanopelagicales bacterium]